MVGYGLSEAETAPGTHNCEDQITMQWPRTSGTHARGHLVPGRNHSAGALRNIHSKPGCDVSSCIQSPLPLWNCDAGAAPSRAELLSHPPNQHAEKNLTTSAAPNEDLSTQTPSILQLRQALRVRIFIKAREHILKLSWTRLLYGFSRPPTDACGQLVTCVSEPWRSMM